MPAGIAVGTAAPSPGAQILQRAEARVAVTTSQTILIVEDEAVVAFDMKAQLQKLGYDVVGIAETGEKAICLADHLRPSLILMDVRLAGRMDGIAAAAAIRRTLEVPIIFLTAHSDVDTVGRAAQTSAYGYLTKPYQIQEVRAGIEVALSKFETEQQLRLANQWFINTLHCVPDAVVLTEPDGRIRYLNPAAERMLGWSNESAVGHDVTEVVKPQGEVSPDLDAAGWLARVCQQGDAGPVVHGLSVVDRGGQAMVMDARVGPVRDESGQHLGAAVLLRDASERLAHEAKLLASERRFRVVFEHAPIGMALTSPSGEFMDVNSALCQLIGSSADDLVNEGDATLSVGADMGVSSQDLDALRAHRGEVLQFDRQYRRLDGGDPVWVRVHVSLLPNEDNDEAQQHGYLYLMSDLSQQKRMEAQEAELQQERLKREVSELASQTKSEFLSRVSHEMRTPLNAVLGFSQLLQIRQEPGATDAQAYAKHIHNAGAHLLSLVDDLLDLNRSATGTLRMALQPLSLGTVLREVTDMLSEPAAKQGVTLEIAMDGDVQVHADALRLRQVLLNLGSNAVKYNREGGWVTFRVHPDTGSDVALVIEDTGIGMTQEQLIRLFQPFDRLGLEKTTIPGVGLGMMIARSLLADMGGALRVESEPGQGTRMVVRLRTLPAA